MAEVRPIAGPRDLAGRADVDRDHLRHGRSSQVGRQRPSGRRRSAWPAWSRSATTGDAQHLRPPRPRPLPSTIAWKDPPAPVPPRWPSTAGNATVPDQEATAPTRPPARHQHDPRGAGSRRPEQRPGWRTLRSGRQRSTTGMNQAPACISAAVPQLGDAASSQAVLPRSERPRHRELAITVSSRTASARRSIASSLVEVRLVELTGVVEQGQVLQVLPGRRDLEPARRREQHDLGAGRSTARRPRVRARTVASDDVGLEDAPVHQRSRRRTAGSAYHPRGRAAVPRPPPGRVCGRGRLRRTRNRPTRRAHREIFRVLSYPACPVRGGVDMDGRYAVPPSHRRSRSTT